MTDLAKLLAAIEKHDPSADDSENLPNATHRYAIRNTLIWDAMVTAAEDGYRTGVAFDPNEPDYPVVYIDLPTGQVSWHITAYAGEWDGHTTEQKYERCRAFREAS